MLTYSLFLLDLHCTGRNMKKKIISAVTLILFSMSQCAIAAPGAGISSVPLQPSGEVAYENLLSKLVIPQELGTVKERFIGKSGESAPTPVVVHIEDAHANYEAQKNIEALIDYLNRQYGFSVVLLEGGVNRLNPEILKLFNNPQHNAEVMDYLLRRGEVTGAESYLVAKTYEAAGGSQAVPVQAYGLESAERYRADLEQFRKIWPETEQGKEFALELSRMIDRASSRTVNRELRTFLKEWMHFKEFRQDLNAYLTTLQVAAKNELKLDLANPWYQKEWPILIRIFKLKDIEHRLDMAKAQDEWRRAKAALLQLGSEPRFLEIIEGRLNGREVSDLYRGISSRALFEKLLDDTYSKGFSFKNYPQLSLWVGNTILRHEIDSEATFQEIDALSDRILEKLATSDEERRIIELLRKSYLLKDLFVLELSRENYLRLKAGEELFSPDQLIHDVQLVDPTTESAFVASLPALNELYHECLTSYELAIAREHAFFDNLKKTLQETKADKAITVTGGFHTVGFTDGFRNNNISYVIVAPRITRFDDTEKERQYYVASLMQKLPSGRGTSLRGQPLDINIAFGENGEAPYVVIGGSPIYAVDQIATAVRNSKVPIDDLRPEAVANIPGLGRALPEHSRAVRLSEKITAATGRFGPGQQIPEAGPVRAAEQVALAPVLPGTQITERAALERGAATALVAAAIGSNIISAVFPIGDVIRGLEAVASRGGVPAGVARAILEVPAVQNARTLSRVAAVQQNRALEVIQVSSEGRLEIRSAAAGAPVVDRTRYLTQTFRENLAHIWEELRADSNAEGVSIRPYSDTPIAGDLDLKAEAQRLDAGEFALLVLSHLNLEIHAELARNSYRKYGIETHIVNGVPKRLVVYKETYLGTKSETVSVSDEDRPEIRQAEADKLLIAGVELARSRRRGSATLDSVVERELARVAGGIVSADRLAGLPIESIAVPLRLEAPANAPIEAPALSEPVERLVGPINNATKTITAKAAYVFDGAPADLTAFVRSFELNLQLAVAVPGYEVPIVIIGATDLQRDEIFTSLVERFNDIARSRDVIATAADQIIVHAASSVQDAASYVSAHVLIRQARLQNRISVVAPQEVLGLLSADTFSYRIEDNLDTQYSGTLLIEARLELTSVIWNIFTERVANLSAIQKDRSSLTALALVLRDIDAHRNEIRALSIAA